MPQGNIDMPHFAFKTNDDSIKQIYKDGQPHDKAVKLEPLFSIVTIYFKLAEFNLDEVGKQAEGDGRRFFGVQSFLMSLIGLEAFTNTFFHLRAEELGSEAIRERVSQPHGSLSKKIKELVELTLDGPLVDQDRLIDQVFNLSQLRNEIVHPRWVPSSLVIDGQVQVKVDGLVENSQAIFEEAQFCHETLMWCLLVVARIAQAHGNEEVSGFMFHWTGNYDLTLPMILAKLGLSEGA